MKAVESFHMKCQRRILGIRRHDLVRNSGVSLRTGLAPVSDRITRGRNATFGHAARLPDNIPAHQAMLRQVESRPYMETSTRSTTCQMDRPTPPRKQQCSHCDSVEASYWSRSLESDATVRADYALTTRSPYSIAERRVPELIPVLGSQPAGDVSHKPCGRLPLLSACSYPRNP